MKAGNVAITCCALIAFEACAGCDRVIRSGPIIAGYENAACIHVEYGRGISPPTRAWDDSLVTSDGLAVHISSAEMPGGRINVRYQSDGSDIVAADAGDYIYPADVRFDRAQERLYIKASGVPAAFGGPQTWLFDFDLAGRRQTNRAQVDPTVLPPECVIK